MAVIYCPSCQGNHECISLNLTNFDDKNNIQMYGEIPFFKRYRECQNCKHVQSTVEIEFATFSELLIDKYKYDKVRVYLKESNKEIEKSIATIKVGETFYLNKESLKD